MKYSMTWDLESVFAGGSTSEELKQKISLMKKQLTDFSESVSRWDWKNDQPNYHYFSAILDLQEVLSFGLNQSFTFVRGVQAADVNDKNAGSVAGELAEIGSKLRTSQTVLIKKLVSIPDADWKTLIALPDFKEIAFSLNEDRTQGKELLSEEEEALINLLSNDGFTGWGNHYSSLVAAVEIPFEEKDGSITKLSAGQAQNKMTSDPDAAVREKLFKKWEEVWNDKTSLFADTLNHLSGFRLATYKAHGVTDFMKRPLEYNRMKKETLDTMWQTISRNKKPLINYLDRKAQLLGKESLSWEDVGAPVVVGNTDAKRYPFDEGADFIVENFRKFSPKMAEFAQYAFDHSWIEAENRSGKRPGGYCANLPETGESRIFMTYAESSNEVSTLAHELGHAFHSSVLRDLPALKRQYAMNVAETASTFAELIVSDATVNEAENDEEKITLLDAKIERSVAMLMNIHARFIFETNFYSERQRGIVTDGRLSELMEEAQKEAYQNSLGNYHPAFWASKMHFYITGVPFYNFPYTFGFLFSLGIYSRSLEEGGSFEDSYIALLKDTGSMTTEELAEKHLNVDLTKPDFWQAGIDTINKDVEAFLELTQKYGQ